ncbi:MAG TPA: hypothetical protein GXZ45_02430 [Propionibacterium sp.]|nr:hypothetical protein [Propionibacterium sp.]
MTRRLLAVLIALVLALTACSGVPTEGPVERVSAAPGRLNPGVEIAPAPPGRNATPITVVEGFLHAMASYQPNYSVARAYLTAEASRLWSPEAGVRIYAEGNPVVETDTSATLRAPVVGTLDTQGAYRQSTETIDHDFGLVEDAEGQWRISNPPAGLLVSEYLFSSAFTRVTPYFYAPGGSWLVPDPRFYPRGAGAYEGAARAVVDGATEWLAPAVEAAPRGVELDSVRVSASGVARVDLQRQGSDLTEAERVALATQLVWSYRSFESIVAVSVGWLGEEAWAIEPYGEVIPATGFPEADPTPRQGSRQLFALEEGRVVRVLEGPDNTHLQVAPAVTAATHAAVRQDALVAATVSADRGSLELAPLGESVLRPLGTSPGLRRPQFARDGSVWVTNDAGELAVVSPAGDWTPLVVEEVGDGRIEAFRISPDGARVALVVQWASGQRTLGLARVRPGEPVTVDGWRELNMATGSLAQLTVLDVGWRAADSLLVLVDDGRSTSVLTAAQDGSTVVPIGPTAAQDLVELAVAPGAPPMVRSLEGEVWRYNSDFRWSQHAAGLSEIFYP